MARRSLTRAQKNIRWIEEYCLIPEGRFVGRPVKLTAEQKHWLHEIYDSPTRLFILSMARKNAKTALSAMLLLLHLCGREAKRNAHLYSAAQSREQAGILFGLATKMIRLHSALNEAIIVRETAKVLLFPEFGSTYRALSAEVATAYGLSPTFVVHDELGQVRGPRSQLYEALETASAAQQEPLSIIISTHAPSESDLLSLLIDDAQSGADPRVKVALYTAPVELDPFSEEAIRAANPHYDHFMNQEEVQRQANDAKRMPSREASYRNLILNQRVETTSPLISRSVWLENAGAPAELDAKVDVYGGLDLSSVADLTALVLVQKQGDAWQVHPTFWLPSEGLAEKSRLDHVPYDVWADQGFLQTTPGKSIEYEFIAEYLRGVFDSGNVKALAFDRYNWKFLKPWLERVGFSEDELERFVEFGQGFVAMSPAIRELESALLAGKLRHGGHPVLTMCAANATVAKDPAENRKFIKGKSTGRIDGMVALAMALGVVPQAIEQAPTSEFKLMFV